MDDLMASIRKIIADDISDQPDTARLKETSLQDRGEAEGIGARMLGQQDTVLRQEVAASLSAAFRGMANPPALSEPKPDAVRAPSEEAMSDVDGMAAIASAIAAQRIGRNAVARAEPAAALSEPRAGAAPASHGPATRRTEASRTAATPDTAVKPTPARQPQVGAQEVSTNVFRLGAEQRSDTRGERAATVRHKPQGGSDRAVGNAFQRRTAPQVEAPQDGLTSARTRQDVSRQLDQLSRTLVNTPPRTLEDLVKDMVQPLLREWLEANLPKIVERQVRQEIERVSARNR